jgi:hypothetical protein
VGRNTSIATGWMRGSLGIMVGTLQAASPDHIPTATTIG